MMENVKKFWKILQVFSQKCEIRDLVLSGSGRIGLKKFLQYLGSILSTFFLGRRGWPGPSVPRL